MGKLQEIILGMTLFAAMITGIMIFSGGVVSANSNSTANDLTTNNLTNDLMFYSNRTSERLQSAQVQGVSILGGDPLQLLTGIYETLRDSVFYLPQMIKSSVVLVAHYTHMPDWMSGVILAMLTIIVVFAILNAIFKWDI